MKITWTTHSVGGYVVHADSKWNNGNSPAGLAMAVHLHKSGATSSHVVHAPDETCGHCPAGA